MANKKPEYYTLYTITCLVNDKVYIGVSLWYKQRICKHFYDLNLGQHANTFLQGDYNIFGRNNFVVDEVSKYGVKHEAEIVEKYYTEYVFKRNRNYCYNIIAGGGSVPEKIRRRYRERLNSDPELKERISRMMSIRHKGRSVSEDTKDKLRQKATGRKATEQTRNIFKHQRKGHGNSKAKKVVDVATGKIYECLKYASIDLDIPYDTLKARVNGYNNVKTTVKWL